MTHLRGRSPIPTRQAVRDGRIPPVPRLIGPAARSDRSAVDVSGPLVDLGSPKSRPVSPGLLYSRVVSPSQVPRGPSEHASTSDRESNTRSPTVPLLAADVDYGQLNSDESSAGNWTTVTKKTARTHRERSVSQSSTSSADTSTVDIATHDMSPENFSNCPAVTRSLQLRASEPALNQSAQLRSRNSVLRGTTEMRRH